MNADLSKLNTRELADQGDDALVAGDLSLARRAYAQLEKLAPDEPHVVARLGLAHSRSPRVSVCLAVLKQIERVRPRSAFVSEGLATWLKTTPFLEDRRFMTLAAQHAHLLPAPNWHWNLQTVVWAVEQVKGLEGDFVELGVFRGHTTLFVSEYLGFRDWPRLWWLYDTFDGVPDDQLDEGWAQANQDTYRGTFSFEEVVARFAHTPNIKVIKGRVPEVLFEESPPKIAFLHVDLNNSTAEIQALEALYDRIVPGGIIVFDDYAWASSRAQHDAEKAWFAARGLVVLALPTGQGVFVKPPGVS